MFRFEKVKRFENIEIAKPTRKTKNAAAYDMVSAVDITIPSMGHSMSIMSDIVGSIKLTPEIKSLVQKMSETNPSGAQDVLDSAVTCSMAEIADITKRYGLKPTLVPTGYKAYMPSDHSLDLYIRSSSPLKYWIILANGTGVIDSDYVDNPDNEGEIFFQVINLLPVPLEIKAGEIIGQAKFVKYGVTDDDHLDEKEDRVGGFGSTTKEESNA